MGEGTGGEGPGGGVKGGVFLFSFFFFSFFLGLPSFAWGWLEWRSHGLPTLVIVNTLCTYHKNLESL
jgi:hypothetical protein